MIVGLHPSSFCWHIPWLIRLMMFILLFSIMTSHHIFHISFWVLYYGDLSCLTQSCSCFHITTQQCYVCMPFNSLTTADRTLGPKKTSYGEKHTITSHNSGNK